MWTCPKCHHQFYNKNQSHSCGAYTVDDFLKDKPEKSVALFHFFLDEYRKIGPFELHPVKTRVALLTKMRFCSANKIGKNYIDIHLVLTTLLEDTSCFYKIDNLANRFFVHHARLYDRDDITDELKKYMAMAYEVGNRAHVEMKKI
ncbi:MAG TPA: DUF5655 domain-containing protein [Mucilaginibacter sp.]|jgi:hypothetical protein|nr:DUF5655 domain-containing protein [Mucilaginibacter sp.]